MRVNCIQSAPVEKTVEKAIAEVKETYDFSNVDRFGKMYEKMSAVEEEANQLYDQLEMQYLAKIVHSGFYFY